MLKHLTNTFISDLEHESELIKERNTYIKADKFSVAEGGIANFSDVYCVGENHAEAAKWLEARLLSTTITETAVDYEKECEEKFDIQVWASHELDISKIKG